MPGFEYPTLSTDTPILILARDKRHAKIHHAIDLPEKRGLLISFAAFFLEFTECRPEIYGGPGHFRPKVVSVVSQLVGVRRRGKKNSAATSTV